MFDKWMKYSYAAQKHRRFRALRIAAVFVSLYVLYNVITAFFVSIWVVQSDSMRSDTASAGLAPGDRLLLVSFALPALLGELRQGERSLPFKRGSIVLIDTAAGESASLDAKLLDGLGRFFTAQRGGPARNRESLFLKRVIALPGDEVSMTNFVFRVKPAPASYRLTEFELADKPYYPVIPQVPALWDGALPFSPDMDPLLLKEDAYFAASDDRGNTSDSRTWGPVPRNAVVARAVFRLWPPARIGRP
jgi:signal peptidase I